MFADDLQQRTKDIALGVLSLVKNLPRDQVVDVIVKQIVRSATSTGANYRAARRAKSKADFICKLKIVEEELDETMYWLELLVENKTIDRKEISELMFKADRTLGLIVTSIKTTRYEIGNASRNP